VGRTALASTDHRHGGRPDRPDRPPQEPERGSDEKE
jgi:hypothetical protein